MATTVGVRRDVVADVARAGTRLRAAKGRSVRRRLRPVIVCAVISLVLTWVVALVLAWTVEPRRGTTSAGEVWRAPGTYGVMQVWESPAAVYAEGTWQSGYKRAWGVEQATGAPDTHGQGDIQTAWAAATPDGQSEWLTLHWSKPVSAVSISVYQTYNPGAIDSIGVSVSGGTERTIWRARENAGNASNPVLVVPLGTGQEIDRLTLHMDSARVPGWNEIDAVCLRDAGGAEIPADGAEASSSYANRSSVGSTAPPSLPSWSGVDEPSDRMNRGEVLYERRSVGAFGWPLPAWVARQSMEAS